MGRSGKSSAKKRRMLETSNADKEKYAANKREAALLRNGLGRKARSTRAKAEHVCREKERQHFEKYDDDYVSLRKEGAARYIEIHNMMQPPT
eukprot:CAMPEP_0173106300 /NCGR_PEP_ID=MMETSP1102-20130122/40858_1 /TAXON_ID=49646 /ORGANISM="Geminigera sp., Strain Caron Lab Isolate" /LENGTH=91 /DNA_ID=CAMNT_0014003189 /DNA_START=109 /DNA_END=381 /DNA_ORIENTATION=+